MTKCVRCNKRLAILFGLCYECATEITEKIGDNDLCIFCQQNPLYAGRVCYMCCVRVGMNKVLEAMSKPFIALSSETSSRPTPADVAIFGRRTITASLDWPHSIGLDRRQDTLAVDFLIYDALRR